MATSSYFAGNSAVKNSIRPAPPVTRRRSAFVQTSGTVATHPAPRAPDRNHIPSTPPPDYSTNEEEAPQRRTPFWMWLLVIGVVALALFVTKVQVVDPWWQGMQNQWHYGDSRIGYSAFVLTGDTTPANIATFIRTDSKTGGAYLIVLEVRSGEPPRQLVKALMGPGATDQTVTTTTTEDANGDGRTDVVVHIQDNPVTFVLLNDGKGNLSWATP